MNRTLLASVLLVAVFTAAARGEGALAVAIPDEGLGKGFTYGIHVNAATPEDARKEAMAACQEVVKKILEAGKDSTKKSKALPGRCRVVESFKKSCVAVALDTKGQWAGWAVFKEEKKARDRAVLRCKDGGLACAVAEAQCDK
jgi:hypothetical protein